MNKNEEYKKLLSAINNCQRCDLYKNVKHRVPGEGNLDADIVFIAEAPGVAEDNIGRPLATYDMIAESECATCNNFDKCFSNFIYKKYNKMKCNYVQAQNQMDKLTNLSNAGMIFDKMLLKVGLSRKDVYITNSVACRPVKSDGSNGKPTQKQIEACSGRIRWLLDIIQPKAVIFVGNVSRTILDSENPGTKMFEIVDNTYNITIANNNGVPKTYWAGFIYHPASLLYRKSMYDTFMNKSVESIQRILNKIGVDPDELWKTMEN